MSRYGSLFSGAPSDQAGVVDTKAKTEAYRILLVDDEPNVLQALRRIFHQENYTIITASNGNEALQQLEINTCQLMITDFKMPGMNGADLLRKVRALYPEMIRIMLTGHADTSAVMAAIKEGAVYKFILKPWNDDDLRVTTALAFEQYDLLQQNRALQHKIQKNSLEIRTMAKLAVTNRSQLVIVLNKHGLLNYRQVQELYKQQQQRREPMIKLLFEKGWVNENKIRDILRNNLMIEEVSLAELQIDPGVSSLLPASLCKKQWVLPLLLDKRVLTLVMADPMDMGLIDDLKFATGLSIQAVMADVEAIKTKISEVYEIDVLAFEDLETMVSSSDPYEGIEVLIDDDEDVTLENLLQGTDEPPAIRLVNAIILEAVRHGASDIHIHPRTKNVVVRYRIDGVLSDKIHVPHSLHMALVSRIKVMAELDITERRRPQDGRITVKTPLRIIDLRISSLPTINGEKIVMRILDRNAAVQELEALGMTDLDRIKIENVVAKPQGIVLVTGPTGSGKTTTLYSMLQHNASPEKNYVTIEDPVEYYLDMAGQVMIKEKIGLDFSVVLRAILRQDPDVILLGEIRDLETAEVAFNAALTGHLVFSTLHTNSAAATIARLFDLGLKPYVIASALEAVAAQRLLRKICEYCREEVEPQPALMHRLGSVFQSADMRVFKGKGCSQCNNSGYKGRIGIYEIVVLSEQMRHLITNGASVFDLAALATKEGVISMLQDAAEKVKLGETTPEEVLRVLGPQVII